MTAIDSGPCISPPTGPRSGDGSRGSEVALLSRERGSTGASGRLRPPQDRGEIRAPCPDSSATTDVVTKRRIGGRPGRTLGGGSIVQRGQLKPRTLTLRTNHFPDPPTTPLQLTDSRLLTQRGAVYTYSSYCRCSFSVSTSDPLACAFAGCLTSCPHRSVSRSCPLFEPPVAPTSESRGRQAIRFPCRRMFCHCDARPRKSLGSQLPRAHR
jgi:hypothetical protein